MIVINKRKLRCPTCGAKMKPAMNLIGSYSNFWMQCSRVNCETYVDTYIPLDYQAYIHRDSHRHLGIFGG